MLCFASQRCHLLAGSEHCTDRQQCSHPARARPEGAATPSLRGKAEVAELQQSPVPRRRQLQSITNAAKVIEHLNGGVLLPRPGSLVGPSDWPSQPHDAFSVGVPEPLPLASRDCVAAMPARQISILDRSTLSIVTGALAPSPTGIKTCHPGNRFIPRAILCPRTRACFSRPGTMSCNPSLPVEGSHEL
ncbi:hypothetical protein P154DRAFT_580343 [Amniculicola lignicola CBS 123094]|uniref:Uncharacterized protein n=1 Tax=Amniculicola lignicola CBS 123094 TaxID=1392246 RepID=A0A6A5WA19_9PLEO|nr:hypothetical protein P154DRAFT_580343 [Amniculicola lignicola CBS 123094]